MAELSDHTSLDTDVRSCETRIKGARIWIPLILGIATVVAIVFSVRVVPTAYARLLNPPPTYDELFEKSDLIVIARPVTKTTDTEERNYFDGVVQINANGQRNNPAAIGVETTFNVIKIIKGNGGVKQFILHHYREATPGSNGPMVVSFDLSQSTDILLFLVREKDGRYAPYGGQTDPGLNSIFALTYPEHSLKGRRDGAN